MEFARKGSVFLRKESIDTELQTEEPSIVEALNQAEALIQSKRYQEARSKLQKISLNLQITGVCDESWRYHYLCGLTYFWLGEQTEAWKEAEEALQTFTRAHQLVVLPKSDELPALVAKNLKNLRTIELALLDGLEGQISDENGRKQETLERRIAEISASLEQLTPLAKLHQLAGNILRPLGKLPEALEHLEWAATGFRLTGDWTSLAETLNKAALARMALGELPSALQVLEQARYYCLKAKDHRYLELVIHSNMAICQLLGGNWRPPLSTLSELLPEAKNSNDFPRYSNTLLLWGWANLLGGRLRQTRRAIVEARHIAAEKNLVGFLKVSYGFSADLAIAEGRLEEAEKYIKTLLELSRSTTPGGEHVAQAWQVLGEIYIARKEYARALKALAVCLEQLSKQPERWVEGAVYRGMGICHAKSGLLRLARKEFKKSCEIFELCSNQWEKAKTIVAAAESGVYTRAEMEPDIAWAKEVFKRLEHPAWIKRARAFLKKPKNSGRKVPLPLTRERTEREQIVRALLSCNGNITQAAKKLGLLRQTLQYKIHHYGIEV